MMASKNYVTERALVSLFRGRSLRSGMNFSVRNGENEEISNEEVVYVGTTSFTVISDKGRVTRQGFNKWYEIYTKSFGVGKVHND
jgi:hypothetical protein